MYSNEKAKQILTLALEIEGLALLIQRRGDLVNPEVNYILRDKASSLHSLTEEMAGSSCDPVSSDAIAPEESSDDGGCSQAAAPCGSMAETSVESDDSAIAVSAVGEEAADSNVAETAEERPTAQVAVSSPVAESNPQHVQPVFTLNDRFRFIRELFKGNSQDFNDTLKQLSSMTSADEVVEYLTEDLCLDPENQDVADFTAIVTQRLD